MPWHTERKAMVLLEPKWVEDPVLTHPSDASQWRALDEEYYKEFGRVQGTSGLVRAPTDSIHLATRAEAQHLDGVCMEVQHPPWLCVKKKYIHMSMLIQGLT
jgi:hypothetical protein